MIAAPIRTILNPVATRTVRSHHQLWALEAGTKKPATRSAMTAMVTKASSGNDSLLSTILRIIGESYWCDKTPIGNIESSKGKKWHPNVMKGWHPTLRL